MSVIWNEWQQADLSLIDISYQVAAEDPWGWSAGDLMWSDMLPQRSSPPQRQAGPDSRMADGYRDLIDRARRDIAVFDEEWQLRRLAAACTPADVMAFLEAL